MTIFDLFSKRKQKETGGLPDIFQYEDIPQKLRVQMVHIWRDAFGDFAGPYDRGMESLKFIHDSLCREYGIFKLTEDGDSYFDFVVNFLLSTKEYEKALDVIEFTTRVIDKVIRAAGHGEFSNPQITPDKAIEETNARFLENGVGYQYESGNLVRIDSKIIHAEVVKPVLSFLSQKRYSGANEEFLKAHQHYRKGEYKECLNECLKAFESTMKTICDKRGWKYGSNDTAKKLIEICLTNHLLPEFFESQFTAIRTILESGVPTARNKLSGHGQGTNQITVSQQFAGYMLHLTATTILYLIDSETVM